MTAEELNTNNFNSGADSHRGLGIEKDFCKDGASNLMDG